MLGKIIGIEDDIIFIKLNIELDKFQNILNNHVIMEEADRKFIGEIIEIKDGIGSISLQGELIDDKFVFGVIRKPSFSATVKLISKEKIPIIIGINDYKENKDLLIGESAIYEGIKIGVNINQFFSNHFAIFGSTGSGKSCSVARIIQNLFQKKNSIAYRSSIFIFDAYGEYHNAFKDINKINQNFYFKYYTTNVNDTEGNLLSIPLWLLDVDDMALLMDATDHSQLPIIEEMLKLVRIFSESGEMATKYKNHLIAKAIMTILYTNQSDTAKRNDIFSILATCSTEAFHLEAPVQGLGYVRKFRECFIIDKEGNFTESILVTQYISDFIDDINLIILLNSSIKFSISGFISKISNTFSL